jgi:D-alanine-D-alanine ligase
MGPTRVTILYDRIEDDVFEEASARGEDTSELVPVHVALGKALASRGHWVRKLAVSSDLERLCCLLAKDDSEVVFNVCDGVEGDTRSAARVAGILEFLGKPFTGSGSIAMALAGDKVVAKQVFRALGIATPEFRVVRHGELCGLDSELRFPVIVKPVDEDASVGITEESVVRDPRSLARRVARLHQEFSTDALVEEFIVGREVYAPILGNGSASIVLPLLEWPLRSGHGFGSWAAKWRPKHRDYQRCANVFAENIPEAVVERIRRDAVAAYRALKLTDYGRIDIRLDADGTPWFLEVNPNPFFDEAAEMAQAASAVGLDYAALSDRVMEHALARHRVGDEKRPVAQAA